MTLSVSGSSQTAFQVAFEFRYGWCRWHLEVDRYSGVHRATSLVDAFGDLAGAVAATASGALVASALWGDEPGGVFVDLARSGPRHLGLVLHEVGRPDWLTPETSRWTPVRGPVVVDAVIPVDVAFRAFHAAFESTRQAVSAEGRISGWGHPFPTGAVDGIGQALEPGSGPGR
jgi:hypothetical protein